MAGSEATSQTFAIPEDLKDHVSWQHPERDLQIWLHRESVQELSTRSLCLCKAANPSEFGGLLWGRYLQKEQRSSAVLLIPRLVPAKASLFNTTAEGAQNLIGALKCPPQENLRLMGFFRSHLREGLCLSPQDEVFIKQHIQDPDSIFLVVRPFVIGICMAGFFFWKDGHLQTDASDLEVPFIAPDGNADSVPQRNFSDAVPADKPSEWRKSSTEPPSNSTASALKARPALQGEAPSNRFPKLRREPTLGTRRGVAPNLARTVRPSRFHWQALLACTIIVFASVVLYLSARLGLHFPASPSPARTEVGLQVNVAPDGQMDVSWNRNAPALQKAQGAMLRILDGTAHRELNLDNDQLRFGKLAYVPNSGDVQFSLEIHLDSSRSISESIRVLPKLGMPQRTIPTSSTGAVFAHSETGQIPASVRLSTPAASSTGPVKSFPAQLTASLAMPTAVHTDTPAMLPPLAPDVPSGGAHNVLTDTRLVAQPLPPAPVWHTPQVPPVSSPKSAAAPVYRPARPLRQVLPKASLTSLAELYRVTSVTVQIQINEKGRVTAVRILRKDPSADALLAARAIAAAKQWTFAPATLHGKNVPSEHTILFRFRPGT